MAPFIEKKCIALIPPEKFYYLDHLAVISTIMRIPLCVLDDLTLTLAQRYYPNLQIQKEEEVNMTPEFLIANYDVLFTCDIWKRKTFERQFKELEKKYRKQLRRVFCPHGFSDKTYYFKHCDEEDICLIYGQNMIEMLKHLHVYDTIQKCVICGNYRYSYFLQNKEFYDTLIKQEILSKFDQKDHIAIFAPTWKDSESATSYFDTFQYVLGQLPSHYNLIVKLHPQLEWDDPAAYYSIMGKYERQPNILFLKEMPLVYPLLAFADLYIGDMSSVGYDFLAFNRPMFFLNQYNRDIEQDERCYLFRCGVEIRSEMFPKMYEIIESHLKEKPEHLSKIRQETYFYTFGKERNFEEIKIDLMEAYQ